MLEALFQYRPFPKEQGRTVYIRFFNYHRSRFLLAGFFLFFTAFLPLHPPVSAEEEADHPLPRQGRNVIKKAAAEFFEDGYRLFLKEQERGELNRRAAFFEPGGRYAIVTFGIEGERDICLPLHALLRPLPPDTFPDLYLTGSSDYVWSRDGELIAFVFDEEIILYDMKNDSVSLLGRGVSPEFGNSSRNLYYLREDLAYGPSVHFFDPDTGMDFELVSFGTEYTFFDPEEFDGCCLYFPSFKNWHGAALTIPLYEVKGNKHQLVTVWANFVDYEISDFDEDTPGYGDND